MKKYKYILTFLLSSCFCSATYAQSEYKGVTIYRGDDVNTVVVYNSNPYPCKFNFEYKVGSKESAWRDYRANFNNFEYREIQAKADMTLDLRNKIYALKLTYVDIEKPTLGEYIDAFAEGWVEGKQKAQQNQH